MSYMTLGFKTWREDLKRYNIRVLEDYEVLGKAKESNVLPITHCSATKGNKGEKAVPRDFYVSAPNMRFYNWCDHHTLEYGVLSDVYGLHLWNEEESFYDVHPSSLDKKQFRQLASKIYFKMESINCNEFLYHGLPPVRCRPYFYMMIITGMKIFYTTKLPKE